MSVEVKNLKVLALRQDGELTYCTARPEDRGKGRCNHIAHKSDDESESDFLIRITSMMAEDEKDYSDVDQVDQYPNIVSLIQNHKVSFNDDPDWESVIRDMPNHFHIGSEKDGSYEEAKLEEVKIDKIELENGDLVNHIVLEYEFRGEKHTVDFGYVPALKEDGTIGMNGSNFRVLPIMSQFKSGYIQYNDKTVVKQSNGHIAMVLEPGSDLVQIGRKKFHIDEVQKALNGEESEIQGFELKCLQNIDPIAYERFPELNSDLKGFRDSHTPDMPNDIEYRKFLTYKDQLQPLMEAQMRRMGVTFRTNLGKKQAALESGDEKLIEKTDQLPLFFQANNTENFKRELVGRSNVQLADNLNPIAALSQSHKVSLTGFGGYNKDKAPAGLRNVGRSHKDIIDSLDVSSGKNIGLTMSLHNADIDSRGFIVKSEENRLAASDFIPYKHNNDLNRAAMACAHMKQACPVLGGEDPKPVGDSSDDAWAKISGSKLGCNLRVAYLPTDGTFEDSVVLSESAAKKLMTKQTEKYKFDDSKYPNPPKEGYNVKVGEYINGVKVKYAGVVKHSGNGSFYVESTFGMGPGDKIAGRHGNKGTASKIYPDKDMPMIQQSDGTFKHAEILMSPMGVPGRMNLSQIYETNGGYGKLNDKKLVKLPSGNTVEITAGEQFVMRLNHLAEKKLSAYSSDYDSNNDNKGLRLGEMESLLLSDSKEKLEVLKYLRNQESSYANQKLESILKSVGVAIK